MIECPSCKHREFVGTLFCSECGTRLVNVTPAPTMSIPRDQVSLEASATKPSVPEGPDLASGALLGLRIVSSGEILSLIGRDNYTLGRTVEGQPVIPDVDLSPYDAFEQGVSRLHCEIRLKDDGVYIVDLESANGTLINGKTIEVQKPFAVKHGDILQLGRMRLQLISRYRK
jgi:hypothetical protein